ncbi:MAG: hypothetical protein J6C24_04745 [Clostridia bacterium]|nr:hypothetical protein [Clostridia bacterium]
MKREKISETIQNISSKHVDEATVYNGGKMIKSRKIWITLAAVAACLILCVSLFLSIGREYVKLDNGDILIFNASTHVGVANMIGSGEVRDLSESEIKSLFKELPVTKATVMFDPDNENVWSIEGYINGKTLLIATPVYSNSCKVDPGWYSFTSNVNGISVEAGYLFGDANIVIYFAEFKLGESTVYIEHSGLKEENDTVKKEIADIIEKLTELGEIDLNIIKK